MADLETLEQLDGFAKLRNVLRAIAEERGEWAGIPMPIEDARLVIEPTYPNAEALSKLCGNRVETEAEAARDAEYPPTGRVGRAVNRLWSTRWRCWVDICRTEDGREAFKVPVVGSGNAATKLLVTLGASDAWGIEQEANAVSLLGTLVRHRQFKQYMMTGTFLETSKRSGVAYLFRRLRPTVAISTRSGHLLRILCALCMHPIAYYADSWAGAMTPTDDVVAHLMMMRGDEPMLWRRSNQHHPHHPEAGL